METASLVRAAPGRSDSNPPSYPPPPPETHDSDPPPSRRPRAEQPPTTGLVGRFAGLSADSTCMREVFTRLERLAPTDIALTLVGETGTGKSLLARAVHGAGRRPEGPFVAFDCSTAPAEVLMEELFGEGPRHALRDTGRGAIARAEGGSLFLKEVGALSLSAQALLLRLLEDSAPRPYGAGERPFQLRIIAASARDLRASVSKQTFREDLYFRLAAALVTIPPLRARLDDLPTLVLELLAELGRPDVRVTPAVHAALSSQSWPGNVRQLRNVLECALLEVDAGVLEERHLDLSKLDLGLAELDHLQLGGLPLADIERAAIKQTLALSGGVKGRAAQALGIAVSTLYDKVKKYGL
jgi:DNA-binding NtrC family response regulator